VAKEEQIKEREGGSKAGPSRDTAGPGKTFSRSPIITSFRLKHPAIFRQLEDCHVSDVTTQVSKCVRQSVHQ